MLNVALLGSTGSIGRYTLDVAARYPDRIRIVGLAAHSNADLIAEQSRAFGVTELALSEAGAAERLKAELPACAVTSGAPAVEALAAHPDADIVVNALVGAAGLRATIAALTAGKTLALANKESLVAGGELVMRLVRPGKLLPVDSEHSAIFQCLTGESDLDIARIWLTASGGPFRGMCRADLAHVTPTDALAHPTWAMGPKITIDSATLMNKGLEVIEAHHLFGVGYDRIRVVVHPQSCVHSMVEYTDGSVKAHLGATDMRIPIQYALSYPRRWDAPLSPVDFAALGRLDFEDPDVKTFRALQLAIDAGTTGGTMPAVMNAANEVAVAAFLGGEIRLTAIDETVERVMHAHVPEQLESIEQVEAADAWARGAAREVLRSA